MQKLKRPRKVTFEIDEDGSCYVSEDGATGRKYNNVSDMFGALLYDSTLLTVDERDNILVKSIYSHFLGDKQ